MDTIPNETNICNITSSNKVSQLKDLISSLAEQVSELKLKIKQQFRAYSPSPRHHSSRSRDSRNISNNFTNSNTNGMYYNHHRFGKNAHHCQKPSSFNSGKRHKQSLVVHSACKRRYTLFNIWNPLNSF
ncbi:hypothetical protein Pmani_007781 [Petrolisthes manimaculis]|uniref:Uncharacterized protein n=1 Tax=Petrolisthes manimaculis TaxID=1843537 RepID=A0AAE1NNA5_9EUCA|nr:hypothetical protein Pmani_034169 [Petrolisthes manimaculis]KAK4312184.1 hypothetical protein Pmani_016359 [Petrolisthes manimaculis]KAK4321411.1 hypothetical protein Pmani_007781 [Petrolisthes manimaculis]